MGHVEDYDNTLQRAKEMDAATRVSDLAKKLAVSDGHLWTPTVDPNKPGGLTEDEQKLLSIQQEDCANVQSEYNHEAQSIFDRLSEVDYTITTK